MKQHGLRSFRNIIHGWLGSSNQHKEMKMTIEIKYKKGDKVYYINDENFYHGTIEKVNVETDSDGNIKIRYNIAADGRWLAHCYVKQDHIFLTKEGLKEYVLSKLDKLK